MSNVPSWERKPSSPQYIYSTFQMNQELGKLVHTTAKKYRSTYGDKLISCGVDAMRDAKIVSEYYAETRSQFEYKLNKIQECTSSIETILTITYIWINNLVEHEGINQETKDKLHKREYMISDHALTAIEGFDKLKWQCLKKMGCEP